MPAEKENKNQPVMYHHNYFFKLCSLKSFFEIWLNLKEGTQALVVGQKSEQKPIQEKPENQFRSKRKRKKIVTTL